MSSSVRDITESTEAEGPDDTHQSNQLSRPRYWLLRHRRNYSRSVVKQQYCAEKGLSRSVGRTVALASLEFKQSHSTPTPTFKHEAANSAGAESQSLYRVSCTDDALKAESADSCSLVLCGRVCL